MTNLWILVITVSFLVLAAAGFGVSRFLRWLKNEVEVLHTHIRQFDAAVSINLKHTEDSLRSHVSHACSTLHRKVESTHDAVRKDVSTVETFLKDHAAAIREDAARLDAKATALFDTAEAKTYSRQPPTR